MALLGHFYWNETKKPAKWRVFLFLLGVYHVLSKLLIILLQSQLLAWILLGLVIVTCVVHVSRNASFGVAF